MEQLCEASHVSHVHSFISAERLEAGPAEKCAFVALVVLGTASDGSLLMQSVEELRILEADCKNGTAQCTMSVAVAWTVEGSQGA